MRKEKMDALLPMHSETPKRLTKKEVQSMQLDTSSRLLGDLQRLIVVLPAILEVLSTCADAHEAFLWQNASRQPSTVDTSSIQANGVLVLLQAAVSVVAEQYRLRAIPESCPWPIVKEL